MERELVEVFEAAKKAADAAANGGGPAEEDRCVDALDRLRNVPVNYQVLVSTQVGKRLRQLTKHPKKKIQALASDLVEIWKNIIVEETLKNKTNGSLDRKDSVKAEPSGAETSDARKLQKSNSIKVEKVGSVKVEKIESVKVEKIESVKVEKNGLYSEKVKSESFSTPNNGIKVEKNTSEASIKVEKVTRENKQTSDAKKPAQTTVGPPKLTSIVSCKDPIRDKIRELLAEALCKVPGEVDDRQRDQVNACDPFRVAVSVESAMFEKWGRSNGTQKFKYRSVMFNIKDASNPDFRRRVLLGEVEPGKIVELTPQEMASSERQLQNVKIKEKALLECERGGPPKATTDQFKCGRCGKRKCTYYQLQTRSADEPMTTFVTCVNCDNHWKFC